MSVLHCTISYNGTKINVVGSQKNHFNKTVLLITFNIVLLRNEPRHEVSNNVVSETYKAPDQPAHTRSLIRAFASRLNMNVKLLTKQHLEFLSFKGGCKSWSESTLVKMPHCWKSHVTAQ